MSHSGRERVRDSSLRRNSPSKLYRGVKATHLRTRGHEILVRDDNYHGFAQSHDRVSRISRVVPPGGTVKFASGTDAESSTSSADSVPLTGDGSVRLSPQKRIPRRAGTRLRPGQFRVDWKHSPGKEDLGRYVSALTENMRPDSFHRTIVAGKPSLRRDGRHTRYAQPTRSSLSSPQSRHRKKSRDKGEKLGVSFDESVNVVTPDGLIERDNLRKEPEAPPPTLDTSLDEELVFLSMLRAEGAITEEELGEALAERIGRLSVGDQESFLSLVHDCSATPEQRGPEQVQPETAAGNADEGPKSKAPPP